MRVLKQTNGRTGREIAIYHFRLGSQRRMQNRAYGGFTMWRKKWSGSELQTFSIFVQTPATTHHRLFFVFMSLSHKCSFFQWPNQKNAHFSFCSFPLFMLVFYSTVVKNLGSENAIVIKSHIDNILAIYVHSKWQILQKEQWKQSIWPSQLFLYAQFFSHTKDIQWNIQVSKSCSKEKGLLSCFVKVVFSNLYKIFLRESCIPDEDKK